MKETLSATEKEFLKSIKTGRSQEEIFASIAARIRESYEGEMDEQESKRLARNLIGFCKKIIEIRIRQEQDSEYESRKEC